MQVELRRPDGFPFFTATYVPADQWMYLQWSGIQTLDVVQQGGLCYLELLRQQPCPRLLNDHREVVGRFTDVNEWIEQVWTPQATRAGLRHLAQVVAPGVFGQLSIQDLHQRLAGQLSMQLFGTLEEAQAWLRSQE